MGTYLTGEVSVIHDESAADFDNFVYSAVFCNVPGGYQINGEIVILIAGETLNVVVQAPPATTLSNKDFLLLGNPIAPQTKVQTGLISGDSHNEVWQFVNIKTGNPTNG